MPNQNTVRSLSERFWERVDHRDGDACWLWRGRFTRGGYGVIYDASAFSGLGPLSAGLLDVTVTE